MLDRSVQRREDSIRTFFTAVHKLWARLIMDPLYRVGDKIENPLFHQKVAEYLKNYIK